MANQQFYRPMDIQTACSILSKAEGTAVILAGGTDLMPRFNKRKPALRPNRLLSLCNLSLNYIRKEAQFLVIGACTTHSEISYSEAIKEHAPLLAKACSEIGSPAIRNAGTIGGNVCNAAPWADGVVALLALDATVVMANENGDRIMRVENFITGPSATDIRRGEFVKEIRIPVMSGQYKSAWTKHGQRKGNLISVASVAVNMEVDRERCRNVKISIGAVGRIPYIAKSASDIIEGKKLSEALAKEAGRIVSDEAIPREDSRATAWYRRKVIGTLVQRVVTSLIE